MLIDERTKIAALLKHHPDALEAIVALSPDFKKLRNPVLRALMAGRTTIAMASKIGGCKPKDFFKALAPLGFESDQSRTALPEDAAQKNSPKPDYLKNIRPDQLINFDVRAMLAEGNDPLKSIQQKVKSLNPGEVLVIINNFEPVPLIKLLEKQGFQTCVNFIDSDTIETYFYKINGADDDIEKKEVNVAGEDVSSSGDWEILLKRYENNLVEIDVRHLEMPMPMMTILENLEVLPPEKALYVYHKRIPVFLLTELKERAFDYRIKEVQDGEVYLLIFKNK
ncbi:DUF2249 domain-containing protein [Sphingobacterium sp. SGG-5]|uniref:DUF2249 domain-containing protein n=1 Tax=Sphingobacterium sp. SGG-5 TaxID=2710881 RepID=UPI0013ECB9DD|nr:DUF2249 domain-containing protein [Sphingobacterium sp. SGG-5]NGM60990.1 DUF2249 domain-containing protein [Sphingobacterium sp. SGG-5]